MRTFIFLLCSAVFGFTSNDILSQNTKIRIDKDQVVSIDAVFDLLRDQTDYTFIYKENLFKDAPRVHLKKGTIRANKLLESCFLGKDFKIDLKGNKIVIISTEPSSAVPQTFTVSGTVFDTDGQPLPGANIVEKGTANGVTADFDGNFSISIDNENATLLVSYIGFATKEVDVNGKSILDIYLQESAAGLDEVVVVGYGTQIKANLTGSVASIDSKQIKSVPVLSADQILQGKAAGVNLTQTSGQPGAANRVRIRGGNSISAGNEPLYVIDGIPIYNDNSTTSTYAARSPSLNALGTLNPSDIQSIEILKDASATSIYGSRGANGVVIITTKRGKSGEDEITFETSTGFQKVRRIIPMLNAMEAAEFENEIFTYNRDVLGLSNQLPVYTEEQIAGLGEGTNWQEEIFRTAPILNYQLTFSGGNEKTRYLLSLGHTDQKGIILNSDYKRSSLRLNLDKDISSSFRIGHSTSLSRVDSDLAFTGIAANGGGASIQGSNSNIIGVAMHFNPITPVRDPITNEYTFQDTHVGESPGAVNRAVPFYNPVALQELSTNVSISNRILSNTFAEFDVLGNLKFKTNIGVDFIGTKSRSYFPSTVRIAADRGIARVGQVESFSVLNENTLNYKLIIGNHNFDFISGYTMQKSRTEQFQVQEEGFVNDILAENNIGTGTVDAPLLSPGSHEWGLLSYLGRLNYGFNNRYLFTATARYDGSSRFGKENKWGFFPSGAFAWRISEEPFIKNLELLSQLKFRTSWGKTGNQEIGNYQSLSSLNSGIYAVGNTPKPGFYPSRIANPDLKWETTTQYDFGIDLGFFKNRLTFIFDYYNKTTNDLLLNVQIPASSGFTTSLQNAGSIRNRGYEFSLSGIILESKKLTWEISGNIAANQNKVLDLGDENQRLIYSSWNILKGQPASLLEVGKPIGNFIGWKTNGWFLTDEEAANAPDQTPADTNPRQLGGNIRYVDINNDGVVDDEDRTTIGNALPKYTGGFSSSISYKGFNLNTSWAFSVGNDIMNFNTVESYFGIGRYNASKEFANRWSYLNSIEENRNATAPTVLDGRNLFSVIDYWVEDASFLRMRNISLSYNLPTEKWGISKLKNVQISISGQNLITITNYSGYDPEVNLGEQDNLLLGYDYGAYPSAKVYTLGINFNF